MILHGIEYQRPTSLNMRILADHVTYSFLAFMKSIFHFCLGCYCGGYSQNGCSNLSSCMCMVNYPHIESWKPVSPLRTTSILLLWKSTEPPWQHFASVPTSLKLRGLDTPNPKFQEMNGYVLFAPTTILFTLVMNSMLQWSAIPLLAKGVPYSNYLQNNVKTSYI